MKLTEFCSAWLLWLSLSTMPALGQNLGSHAPPAVATGAERLLVEQVEELSKAGQLAEAASTLEKLFEQSEGRLIEAEGLQRAATQVTQRYVSIRHWTQLRLANLLKENVAIRQTYLKDHDDAAAAALAEVAATKDLARARLAAERFSQTTSGSNLQLLLTDLYLERGWGLAATQSIQRQLPSMRFSFANHKPTDSTATPSGTLAWPLVLEHWTEEERRRGMEEWYNRVLAESWQSPNAPKLAVELLKRSIDAAVIHDPQDRNGLERWILAMADAFPQADRHLIRDHLRLTANWHFKNPLEKTSNTKEQWPTFGGNLERNCQSTLRLDPAGWPTWNHSLERYNASSDRISASKPRVAESEVGLLSYHPAVYQGRVYVHELNRIAAYELGSGAEWPEMKPPLPLFDSHIAPAALLPLGYPMVGAARGTLSIYGDCLYARMGAPVTGWANGEKAGDGGSIGYIVGIDLQRQGSLLKGFPLHLSQFDFGGSEPEGCPLAVGDKLYVTVAKRDNVGLRRSVAAFDRFSGQLIWKSPALAIGTVEGSDRANLLAHQLLTMEGGRLFYNTNLGSIACLDPLTGQIEWLVRYRRYDKEKQAYPRADRFRYRDLNPCVIRDGLVYCSPQDCPEVFALDALTGDLVWSTDDSAAADVVHLLGVTNEHLIASGDRLLWLDRRTGRIDARFPAAGSGSSLTSLPSPRGLGRGVISANEIYWPTANEIIVFATTLKDRKSVDAPPMQRRIRLESRGSEGGNLIAVDGWLLVATPSRLLAFAPPATVEADKK
ncbi:MAG: PQQ-binding-like beta-propeller repeat protein [Pirellulaceae bacterium]|nr:PQQ-binding-like beta-propeller repeat protein [Pirellulaceae bacterium]